MAAIDTKSARQQGGPGRHPFGFCGHRHGPQQDAIRPISPAGRDVHTVVNAVAHVHIKTPRLPKQRFIAGSAAAVAMAGGLLLGIRLRFHNHAPEQLAIGLAFHQQAADQLGGNDLGGAGEEGLEEVAGEG